MTVTLPGGVPMTFCWCPATTSEAWKKMSRGRDYFLMGSPEGELGRNDDEAQHTVKLTKGFWLAQTPVTQRQYEAVKGKNPTKYDKRPDIPVATVTWLDCVDFCRQLAAKIGDGSRFELPTEAQWEYACRAGTTSALNNGKKLSRTYGACPELDEVGWHRDNSRTCKQPVKQKRGNAWKLFDMHGNVEEWCADWYGAYGEGMQIDPIGLLRGDKRVMRGGGAYTEAYHCRSAFRNSSPERTSYDSVGFRPVMILPDGLNWD